MTQDAGAINDIVERVALLTGMTEFKNDPGTARVLDTSIAPKSFRRILPVIDDAAWKGFEDNYLVFAPGEVRPRDLDGPLAVSFTANDDETPGGFVVIRLKELAPEQFRGRTHQFYRHVVDHSALFVDPASGDGIVKRWLFGSNDGLRWSQASNVYRPGLNEGDGERVMMGYSFQFTQRYFWHVELGWEGFPTVLIPTDPVGVREVFRLRDIPEGRARRAALRHWVAEHARQRRSDPSEEVKVREHLRGATKFRWNGMLCNVEISRADLDREKIARGER